MSLKFPMKFGSAGEYEMSEAAFNHILRGDTKVRPLGGGAREYALSGGLHTWSGWEAFVALHPKIVHLLQYRLDQHDDWFFARELQNGVITLKIPRGLFTGDGASITKQPDLHYKSGYLWKTLYPMSFDQKTIIEVIEEALKNIDKEDSNFPTAAEPLGVLYGYAKTSSPLTAIKLRFQLHGNQIKSAFPAWEQPMTGNNGKPYSHEHSISFNIAESTVKGNDYKANWGPVFPGREVDLNALVSLTPPFIRTRAQRDPAESVDEWQARRQAELQAIATVITPHDLANIETYLADYVCAKDPYYVQHGIYVHALAQIDTYPELFNAAQLTENIGECLWVLAYADKRLASRRAINAIERFLKMAVVHTGGLNSLMFKRLLGRMLIIVQGHPDISALKDFLETLAASPCRATLYTEFDLNPFIKLNNDESLCVTGVSDVEMELKPEHLFEFIALNLGENYLLEFTKEQRLAMASSLYGTSETLRLATDVLAQCVGKDFSFFIPVKLDGDGLRAAAKPPSEDSLMTLTRDYSRMLVLLRQRVVLEDPDAYRAEPDMNQWGTQAFFELTKQKHKRSFVLTMHQVALRELKQYADEVGYRRLFDLCDRLESGLSKERVPMPKSIPDYIPSWMQAAPPNKVYTNAELVSAIFGGPADEDNQQD